MMVGFRQGNQSDIDSLSTFESGVFYVALDTGNMYLGQEDGSKVQIKYNTTFSTQEPTSSDGKDGDLWLVYAE